MDCDNCKNIDSCRFVEEGRLQEYCKFYIPKIDSEVSVDKPVILPERNSFGQWIETRNGIPEEHIDVLGIDNNGDMKVCWIDNYNKGFYMTNGDDQIPYSQVNIIKWMPLPKP